MSTTDSSPEGTLLLDEVPPTTPVADDHRRRKLIILGVILGLIGLIAGIFVWYLITRKPISALPLLAQESMPHYSYSIYGVSQPLGVAVTPDGQRIYVTQSDGDRTVLAFDHDGKLVATLQPPKSTGPSHVPVYVAVNPTSGEVYVSDRVTAAVYVYDADGTYKRDFKPAVKLAQWAPMGLAFDAAGQLYVTDVGTAVHRILVFDASGALVRTLKPTDMAMSFPNGIAIDGNGTALVADSNNGRALAFSPTGDVVASVNRGIGDGDLGLPRGVATDDTGRIYVVDTTNQSVHVYRLGDPGSNKVTFVGSFGDEGVADGLFEYPNGIAADTRSNVYVTDRENGRVQVWSY
jgi:DNA-binding beta-propeller fold protein YncE